MRRSSQQRAVMKAYWDAKQANDTAKIGPLKPAMDTQRTKMKEIRAAEDVRIAKVLTADQNAQYLKIKADRAAREAQRSSNPPRTDEQQKCGSHWSADILVCSLSFHDARAVHDACVQPIEMTKLPRTSVSDAMRRIIMNRKKSFITIAVIALLALIGLLVRQVAFAKETPTYRFATVTRGDMKATVSATGTLNAVTTVSVGTQVSGQVSELLVDFNDHVKKGQLLARIDPTLALQAVTDAQANLEKSQAQARSGVARLLAQSRAARRRPRRAAARTSRRSRPPQVAQAGVKSARIALDRARQNLAYTNIYAPIDGVVVERNVQQGQTVAASLSAPQLFLIANDLSQMQILAQVGESDIAQIKQGQPAEFTRRRRSPNQTFNGTVKQVRLQSTTQDNVVNYTVVVGGRQRAREAAARHDRARELPDEVGGERAEGAECGAALPAGDDCGRRRRQRRRRSAHGSSTATQRSARRRSRRHALRPRREGQPQAIRVQTGITDGTTTEVRGNDIKEGMKVIAGTVGATQTAQSDDQRGAVPVGRSSRAARRGARGGF